MKKILFISMLICQMSIAAQNDRMDFPQADTIIKEDSMNLAILMVDFTTYEFHSANVSYYTKCTNECDFDGLPFLMYFDSYWDFARVYFYYTYDSSLLFGAWIIWMGAGTIFYPTSFLPDSSFPYTSTPIPLPADAEYYNTTIAGNYCSWDEYIARGQMAWDAIDSLEIVNLFAAKPFRVGLYGYSRTEGMFDPENADWMIFLYRGNDWPDHVQSIQGNKPFLIYPNPADRNTGSELRITNYACLPVRQELRMKFTLFDIFGRNVKSIDIPPGKKDCHIDVSELPDGMYVAQIETEDGIIGNAKLVVK